MQAQFSEGNALRPRYLRVGAILLGLSVSLLFGCAEEPKFSKIDIPDRLELARLLKEGQFARLDQLMNQIQDAYESKNIDEGALRSVVLAFHRADPEFAERLSEWRAAFPKSFAPYVASGSYQLALAWVTRGTELAHLTSAKQFEVMKGYLLDARASYRVGIEKRARIPIAWADLISVSLGSGGGRRAVDRVYLEAKAVLPASSMVHRRYHYALSEKWYGSKIEQRQLRDQLLQRFPDNPSFKWAEFVEDEDKRWDQAHKLALEKRALDALAIADSLLQRSETRWNRLYRGNILYNLEKYDEALEEYFRALRMSPGWSEPVKQIQYVMTRQRRRLDSIKVWQQLIRYDPYNPEFLLPYASFLGSLAMHEEAHKLIDRALVYGADDDEVRTALGRRHLVQKKMEPAIAEMRRAVGLVPARADNWLYLARALQMNEDCSAIEPYKVVVSICKALDEDKSKPWRRCKLVQAHEAELSIKNITEACD